MLSAIGAYPVVISGKSSLSALTRVYGKPSLHRSRISQNVGQVENFSRRGIYPHKHHAFCCHLFWKLSSTNLGYLKISFAKIKKKKRTSQKRKWGTRHNHMGLPCTWCSLSTYHNWPVDNKNSSNSPKQVQETHYIKKFAIYKCIFHFPRYYISLTRSPKTRNDRVLLYSRQSYFVKAAVL